MNITKTNNLSFYNDQGILTLTAKQFDTGRRFIFHIMDNDTPLDLSGCTAYLRIAKADGTQFQGHECCIVECSKIIINTSVGNGSQILTAAGINVCELHLKDANDIALTTWTFHIVVEPRVHDGSHMSSIDSYDVLDNMITMEKERIANEKQRKENEENRKAAFEQKIGETNTVITECRLVIDTANQKINSFDEEINEIVDGITDEAQSYANNAKVSETNAANAASGAADSANTASQKASDAAASATLSQSYAVGGTQSRAGEDSDNAKYYSEKSQETLENLQKTVVTGIKGETESTYRTGNVNLTAKNIGALPASNGRIGNDDESFTYNGFGFWGTGNQSIDNFDTISATHIEALGELTTDNIYTTNMEVNDVTGHCITLQNDDSSIEFTPEYIQGDTSQRLKNFYAVEAERVEGGILYYDGEDTDERYIRIDGNSIGGQNGQYSRAYLGAVGGTMADNDYWGVMGKHSGSDCGYLDIATGDNGNEPIYVTQYSDGNFKHVFDSSSIANRATLLDENGNTIFPQMITSANIGGNLAQFRAIGGEYGFLIRSDGADTYFLLTDKGNPWGNWNHFRPLVINNATGKCNINGNALTANTTGTLGQGGNADIPMTFHWSGQGGQPSWLWGGHDGRNHYVYNPSNFNVNSAGKVRDNYDGRDTTFAYSQPGLDINDFTWLAAWNGSELRAVDKDYFLNKGNLSVINSVGAGIAEIANNYTVDCNIPFNVMANSGSVFEVCISLTLFRNSSSAANKYILIEPYIIDSDTYRYELSETPYVCAIPYIDTNQRKYAILNAKFLINKNISTMRIGFNLLNKTGGTINVHMTNSTIFAKLLES